MTLRGFQMHYVVEVLPCSLAIIGLRRLDNMLFRLPYIYKMQIFYLFFLQVNIHSVNAEA